MKIRNINMLIAKLTVVIASSLVISPVIAGSFTQIPEPGMLPLLGLGAIVMVAVGVRKRRNKK